MIHEKLFKLLGPQSKMNDIKFAKLFDNLSENWLLVKCKKNWSGYTKNLIDARYHARHFYK